jgi:hypothetical protein
MKSKVCILAARIKKAQNVTLSQAMSTAWKMVKTFTDLEVVTFKKVSGEVCRRVVSKNWAKYQPPTGTGRPVKEGLVLVADMGKVAAGINPVISMYKSNIISW